MREALARSDDDFIVRERPRNGRRTAPGLFARLTRAAAGTALARPGRTLALLVAGGIGGAIIVNALALQEGRHPSPLFGAPLSGKGERAVRLGAAMERTLHPAAVRPPARPPELARDAIGEVLRMPVAPAAAPATASKAPAAPLASGLPARDTIGDIIRSGDAGSDPQRLVLPAQRALTKLGYGPLKADGIMGIGTRLAIERFEKDRNLAVTGELGPRTARALAAAAGMPVE